MHEFGMKTLELFERSIIIQALLTTMILGACVYLWLAGREVPPELGQFAGLILGFWFGTKVQQAATGTIARNIK